MKPGARWQFCRTTHPPDDDDVDNDDDDDDEEEEALDLAWLLQERENEGGVAEEEEGQIEEDEGRVNASSSSSGEEWNQMDGDEIDD